MIVIHLDKLLLDKKMHSVELASELGLTAQTVSRIKNSRIRALRLSTLNAICKRFDCQPGDVLEYVTEEDAIARYDEKFVARYRKSQQQE